MVIFVRGLGLLGLRRWLAAWIIATLSSSTNCADVPARERRLFAVSDAIEMTVPGDPLYGEPNWSNDVGIFSPTGRQFVVVVRHGDVASNTNVYRILLWRMADVERGRLAPTTLVEMRSSSNRPGINSIEWNSEDTVLFLGENPGEQHQLYKASIATGLVERVTNHQTSVLAYSRSANSDAIAFLAARPAESLWNSDTRRYGFIVPPSRLELSNIILGGTGLGERDDREERRGSDLFVQSGREERPVPLQGALPTIINSSNNASFSISPDGDKVVVAEEIRIDEINTAWSSYDDPLLRGTIHAAQSGRTSWGDGRNPTSSRVQRYSIFDVRSGRLSVLLDAPISIASASNRAIVWSPDGNSVLLGGVFRPIDAADGDRSAQTLEVFLRTSAWQDVSFCARPISWTGNRLTCQQTSTKTPSSQPSALLVTAERTDGQWNKVRAPTEQSARILVSESMADSPRLLLQHSGLTTDLINLNPQLAHLRVTRVEEITWSWNSDTSARAGLYYPIKYVLGRRYPLVIQTHGWSTKHYWPEGFSTTGYAAQALAARGMFVLQLDDTAIAGTNGNYSGDSARRELEIALQVYQSAVDNLVNLGLIDRSRVGIIGFSQTSYYTIWALTNAPHLFAAASIGESSATGYLAFLSRFSLNGDVTSLYGGPPVGAHLRDWVERAPTFNLDRVRTPLRISVAYPYYLPYEWELFEGLNLLRRPVEMVVLESGEHVLKKPWERLAISGGNVDWFDYWLNGREPTAADASQRDRYREMRSRLCAAFPTESSICVRPQG